MAVLLVSCQCEKDEILEQSVMKTSLVSIQENDLNKSRLQLAFMLSQALSGDYKMQNRLIDVDKNTSLKTALKQAVSSGAMDIKKKFSTKRI